MEKSADNTTSYYQSLKEQCSLSCPQLPLYETLILLENKGLFERNEFKFT